MNYSIDHRSINDMTPQLQQVHVGKTRDKSDKNQTWSGFKYKTIRWHHWPVDGTHTCPSCSLLICHWKVSIHSYCTSIFMPCKQTYSFLCCILRYCKICWCHLDHFIWLFNIDEVWFKWNCKNDLILIVMKASLNTLKHKHNYSTSLLHVFLFWKKLNDQKINK